MPRSPEAAYACARQIAISRCCCGLRLVLLALEPAEEPVELVPLEVEGGQPGDHAELAVEVGRLLEGPPEHLDGLLGAELAGEGLGQREDDLDLVGVDADRPPEGVEALVLAAELEAEAGEELVVLGVAGRRGDQVAPGLEGLFDPAEPGLELGDAGEVLGPVAAVELGQPSEGVDGLAELPGRLADPRRQGPGRDRSGVGLDRLGDRGARLGELAVGLEVSGQPGPARGGDVLAADLLAEPLDPLRHLPARLVILDLGLEDRAPLLVVLGEPLGGVELRPGVVEPLGAVQELRPA